MSMGKKIPIAIEPVDTEIKKSIGWTAVGYTAGAFLAGPMGGIVGALTQGNEEYLIYRVTFSDNSQKQIKSHKNKIALELLIWLWRIENKKSEDDYITFGIDFGRLTWGQVVPVTAINKYLGLEEGIHSVGEAWQKTQLELGLKETLKNEIQRYFLEQKGFKITVWAEKNGFKIPSQHNKNPDRSLGVIESLIIVTMIIGMAFLTSRCQNSSSNNNYQPSSTEQR